MNQLHNYLNILESKIEFSEKMNLAVSKSNVAWQIDHTLKIIIVIVKSCKHSEPDHYKWNFNIKRAIIFTLNNIQRGKAQAPKITQSVDVISKDDLINQFTIAKKMLVDLEQLSSKHHFQHPFLGSLNISRTIKFLEIHTYHHLKIINDILK